VVKGERLSWSTPRVIFEAYRIEWLGMGGRNPLPLIDRSGTIHIMFSVFDRQELVYLREPTRSHVRHVTEFLAPRAGFYGSLALEPHGELYMTYISGFSDDAQEDVNSVFFRRSTNEGLTWEEPVLVSRSGREEAHGVQMAVMPEGPIHLVWRKNKSGGWVTEVVWYSRSDDGGHTWSQPGEWTVPGASPTAVRVAADSAGGAHAIAVFQGRSSRISQLFYSHWNGDAWSSLCALGGGQDAYDPDLITDARGRVHLVWSRVMDAGQPSARGIAMHSVLVPGRNARVRSRAR
jgi:hypothetical protein